MTTTMTNKTKRVATTGIMLAHTFAATVTIIIAITTNEIATIATNAMIAMNAVIALMTNTCDNMDNEIAIMSIATISKQATINIAMDNEASHHAQWRWLSKLLLLIL